MASKLLNFPSKLSPYPSPNPTTPFPKTPFLQSFITPILKQTNIATSLKTSITCSTNFLSSQDSLPFTPPSTREEAITQAKICLSTTLQKPLNNTTIPLPTRKLKKQRQPRFRVEIPVVDDSPDSLSNLAVDIFANLNIKKKGSKINILILWSSAKQLESAQKAFNSAKCSNSVTNSVLKSVTSDSLSSTDLAVILAPRKTELELVKAVTDELYPKPVVLFNPQWGFDEEKEFEEGLESFVSAFEVVYSFMGLEVKGVLSKRRGMVFRCVKDGITSSGEGWIVMVDNENNGELKIVTKFKRRPAMVEVENVLYNLMAANSPVTKSVKFISDLVSNVTGRKGKK